MVTQRYILPGGTLYPFQGVSLQYTKTHNGRTIIGDERGLGKTPQALAWLYYNPSLRPAIIVCPATIKLQWQKQTVQWLGIEENKVKVIDGTRPARLDPPPCIVIINYDILSRHLSTLQKLSPKALILDECQKIKNKSAARTKAATALARTESIRSVVGLTGTMFLNRPREGWSQVGVVNPSIWPNEFRYLMRYCNPHKVNTTAQRDSEGRVLKDEEGKPLWNKAWDFTGASNVDELNRILRAKVLIRRTKDEVYKDMPKLQRVTIPLQCDLSEYGNVFLSVWTNLLRIRTQLRSRRASLEQLPPTAQQQALAKYAEDDSLIKLYGMAIAEIAKLRVAAGVAKVKPILQWAEDFIEEGNPLLLFSHHHQVSDALTEGLEARGPIPPPLDGRMTVKMRVSYADRFIAGEIPILVAGLTAMGEGFDGFQRVASHVAFAELGWNPAIHDQAEGRLDRVGQTSPVTSYYLLATGTIDESLARVIDAKGTVVSASYGELPPQGILEALMDDILGEEEK